MTFEKEFEEDAYFKAITNEFQTTSEIAKVIGCSSKFVEIILNEFAEQGKVIKSTKKAGGRFKFQYIWKLAEAND